MRMKELHIKSFGKFSEVRMPLGDGINLMYGENETGKTTLHHFIRGMLFGIDKQRGKAARTDVYSTYEPWENPVYYAGTMRFSCGGKMFRIERNFHKLQKMTSLVCETDGEELSVEQGDLEVLLDGMTETGFDNTVSIRQVKSVTEKALAAELKNYAANYYETGDFDLNLEKALRILTERKKGFQKRVKREQDQQQVIRESLLAKINYVEEEIESKAERLEKLDNEVRVHKKNMEAGEKRRQEYMETERARLEKIRKTDRTLGILPIAAAVVMIFFFHKTPLTIVPSVLCALLGVWFLVKKPAKEERKVSVGPVSEKSIATKKFWHSELLREEVKEKRTDHANMMEELEELGQPSEGIRNAMRDIEAVDMALQSIRELSGNVQEVQNQQMNRRASQILCEITGGKYQSLSVDEELNIRLNTKDKLLHLHQVSRGTMEQIYFAIRMAAAEILYGDGEVPVILDDTFVMYDEERLRNTLHWLAKRKGQTLIFTCHRREGNLLEEEGIPYKNI